MSRRGPVRRNGDSDRMTILATSQPEPYLFRRWCSSVETADQRARRRRMIKADNRCPVCDVLIGVKAKACRQHCGHGGRPFGARVGNSTEYASRIYSAPLTELPRRGMWKLSVPATMCAQWGTETCRECGHEIPPECPGLDNGAMTSCDACDIPCRCAGTEKGREQDGQEV